MTKNIHRLFAALACSSVCAYAQTVNFNTSTDLATYFRKSANVTTGHNLTQSGGVLNVSGQSATTGTNALVYIYDTTPGDAAAGTQSTFSVGVGQSLSVSIDIGNLSSNAAGTSVGVYFFDPTKETTAVNYMALMNINNGGANELFRFSKNAALANTGINGSLDAGSPNTGDTGITVSDPVFRTVTATYIYNSATSISMSLVSGSVTSTFTYTGITALNTLSVAFRVAPPTGTPVRTLQLDNFVVTSPIPEPSSFAILAGLASVGFAGFGRRRRK